MKTRFGVYTSDSMVASASFIFIQFLFYKLFQLFFGRQSNQIFRHEKLIVQARCGKFYMLFIFIRTKQNSHRGLSPSAISYFL